MTGTTINTMNMNANMTSGTMSSTNTYKQVESRYVPPVIRSVHILSIVTLNVDSPNIYVQPMPWALNKMAVLWLYDVMMRLIFAFSDALL